MPAVSADTQDLPAQIAASRPFIKWAGGKTRLLDVLLPLVPCGFRQYHEPFVGGGAMFFAVGRNGALPARISDLNEDLINLWKVVRDHPLALHRRLKAYGERDSERFYYDIRTSRFGNSLDRAAHFFYLNRTSWNGLYRVNRWGEFNVPWGARGFAVPSLDSLRRTAVCLDSVTIECGDFRSALGDARSGDFVYLDPPYLKISDTSKFNGYTQRRFGPDDLLEMAETLRQLTECGVRWVLSNRDSPAIRELFAGNHFTPLTVRRSVAAQNRRSVEPADSPEVIISNMPPQVD